MAQDFIERFRQLSEQHSKWRSGLLEMGKKADELRHQGMLPDYFEEDFPPVYHHPLFTLRTEDSVVEKAGKIIPLTPMETQFLIALARRVNKPVSLNTLNDEVFHYGGETMFDLNRYARTRVSRLKRKLGFDKKHPIKSIMNSGYMLIDESSLEIHSS